MDLLEKEEGILGSNWDLPESVTRVQSSDDHLEEREQCRLCCRDGWVPAQGFGMGFCCKNGNTRCTGTLKRNLRGAECIYHMSIDKDIVLNQPKHRQAIRHS